MATPKEKILELSRPLTDSLTDIGAEIGVSRQYVHQVVTAEEIPYIVGGIKSKRACLNPDCTNPTSYPDRDAYCEQCSPNAHKLRRKGKWVKCTLCETEIYRCQSYLKRTVQAFCNVEHYNMYRRDIHRIIRKK